MLTLEHNRLTVRFPEIHPDAVCTIEFQRTLRIPDDNRTHNLPPGLGCFPLAHVDDHADRLPAAWQKRGGVFLPMHQTEAMWVKFHSRYPFAVKIAAGKINAVTGKPWTPELKGPRWVGGLAHDLLARRNDPHWDGHCGSGFPLDSQVFGGVHSYPPFIDPSLQSRPMNVGEDQDYMLIPKQKWLDGFCVEKGKIRQFVAMPLGSGYTVEEQITGEAVHGGLQIIVYPLKPEFYNPPPRMPFRGLVPSSAGGAMFKGAYSISASANSMEGSLSASAAVADMGMAPGGLMEQNIYEDTYGIEKFDQTASAKCFVHLLNSEQYTRVTGKLPPHAAPTAADYTNAGLPWFKEWDTGSKTLPGAKPLKKLDSVANLGNKKGENPLPDNTPVAGTNPILLVKIPNQVREGDF
jgi:hypothetical protein